MKNIPIARKLAIGFGACLLILVALSGFAVLNLSAMNTNVMQFANDRLPKANMAGDIDGDMGDYKLALAKHVLATDAPRMAALEMEVKAADAAVDADMAKLRARLTNDESRAALGALAKIWDTTTKEGDAVLPLSRAMQTAAATAQINRMSDDFDAASKGSDALSDVLSRQSVKAAEEAANSYATARLALGTGVLVAMGLVAALLLMMTRLISVPLGHLTSAIGELAKGKLDTAITVEDRRDEVGRLAVSVGTLRDQLSAAERGKAEQVELIVGSIGSGLTALSKGDLTARIDADLTGPFAKLKTDFNEAMHALIETMTAVSGATGGIRTGSQEISQASDDLSRRTEQQAASLEETAAAMDEITATVRETATGAVRANEVVGTTRSDAENGGRIVRQAVEAMGGIERSSNEISEIISVIDGIAFQTNLLALNAGVEAARAGDAGRGFAVVASEVRALAQRSADAAKDVKTKITASVEQVEIGVALVGQTGQALERIVTRIGEISQLVSDIATSAEQQASGLQQVNTAVGEMDSVTQQNAAMVEEANAAARSLAGEAEDLARHVARFRLDQNGNAAIPVALRPVQTAATCKIVAKRRGGGVSGSLALAQQPGSEDWSQF